MHTNKGDLPAVNPHLNSKQREAVYAPHEPLLIIAGAGTGKTRTLTSRLRHLIIEEGIAPGKICALTFTNKAAKEMAERVAKSQPGIAHRNENSATSTIRDTRYAIRAAPFIGTFHSLGARILRKECRYFGRTPNFAIFDKNDTRELIKKVCKVKGIEVKEIGYGARSKETLSPAFALRKISDIKSGISRRENLDAARDPKDAFVLYALDDYEAALRANNAFDFDDLIEKVVRLFREHEEVRKKYAARAEYLLIDEYQDLNNMQYELVRLLANDSRKISVVGDDAQMIYTFRGSNFDIFLNFERDWVPARVVLLEENYRSSGTIIAAASAVIAHNREQKQKKLWTQNLEGARVKIIEAMGEDDEAMWVAEQIELRIRNNELRERSSNANNSTIHNSQFPILTTAILYRTNAQSRAIETALIDHEIPYRMFGGLAFYERREVKDVMAALRYASNPRDSVSRDRLFKTFRRSVFTALESELRRVGENAAPAAVIGVFLKTADYINYLENNFPNALERRENIAELISFASQFKKLPVLLERVGLLQATDEPAKSGSQSANRNDTRLATRDGRQPVSLMSIHLAKGLEFDQVFIVGANEGILPHNRALETERELEEERRLMYVAMTRARQSLAISFYDIPSRFISEIPEELTEYMVRDENSLRFSNASDPGEKYITLE